MNKKLYTSLATGALTLVTTSAGFAQTLPSSCASIEDMYAPGGCLIEGTDIYEHPATGAVSTPGRVVVHAFVGDDGVRSPDIALVGSGYELKAPGSPTASPTTGLGTIPEAARNALNARGVDLVYFDFVADNNNFAQAKSYVLQDSIRLLNDWRAARGENGETIYIGLSLGGVVGRHALRSLELQGYDHKVRTMFTWDSPHLGANVPIGIQQMPKELIDGTRFAADDLTDNFFGALFMGAAARSLRDLADYVELILDGMIVNPASQQLIIKHVYEPDLGMHPYAVELQRELAEIGMPELSHNVAVAAGGIYADPNAHGRKPKFFDFDATASNFFTVSFDVWRDDADPHLLSVLSTNSIFGGTYPGQLSTEGSMDTVPCSTIYLPGEFSDFVFDGLVDQGFILNSRGNYLDDAELYDESSCFVPTLSSLGIDSLDIMSASLPTLSELEELSPFDELYAGHAVNYNHHSAEYWVFQDSFEQHLDRTYGAGTPCSQICENATVFEQPNQQLTNLGTGALCMEFPESVSALVFGGFASSRQLSVNGVSLGTGSWTNNLPPAINGGYCLSAPAGNDSWAWLSTWQ